MAWPTIHAVQVDSPGTADNAGVPGKEHTSVVPSGGQEAVCADEMVELNVKTLAGRVDSLTVSRRATFASILLAYLKLVSIVRRVTESIWKPPFKWAMGANRHTDRAEAGYLCW